MSELEKAKQEVEQVCFSYDKAGGTGDIKDWKGYNMFKIEDIISREISSKGDCLVILTSIGPIVVTKKERLYDLTKTDIVKAHDGRITLEEFTERMRKHIIDHFIESESSDTWMSNY